MTEMPSLQKTLLCDETFSKKWMQLYEAKWVPELLQMGIWNCKTFALMSKMILEIGNSRWNLWIQKIEIIEQADNHVVLVIHTRNGMIQYDPMEFLYHKDSQV